MKELSESTKKSNVENLGLGQKSPIFSFSPSQHTPGPWHYPDRPSDRYVRRDGATPGTASIARLCGPRGEAEANGYLIASAPDLLETVEVLAYYLSDDPRAQPLVDASQKVIRRAKGGL